MFERFKLYQLFSRLGLRRNQDQSSLLVSSRCDSPTVRLASEAGDILDPRKSQETGPPSLRTLPFELVLLISELLPPADALCLALTCKRMRNMADISCLATRLDTDATDTLLCRLERDTTGFSYCFRAQKLRPAQFPTNMPVWSHIHLHDTIDLERVPFIRVGLFMLEFCKARIVTNHQLLGPRHGVPASYLAENRNYRPPWWAEGIWENQVWAANMIYGELFLSCMHTIFHKEANAGALQHFCNFCNAHTRSIEICSHLGVGGPRGIRLPKDVIGNTKHQVSGWCQKCETDWEVNTRWADTERGWTVTVGTYHGLGACRSPQDQKWQAMSINRKAKAYREMPGGGVKQLWEQHKSQLPPYPTFCTQGKLPSRPRRTG